MIKSINQVTVRGRIGNVKLFGTNGSVASFSVATVESYKDKSGNWQDTTTWHRVKAFASRPGMIDFSRLDKGVTVQVDGKIAVNKYTDRDGKERESVEIEAADIVVIEDVKADRPNGRAHNYEEDF